MRIGLSVYDVHAGDLVELAVAADELGFDSLWLGEHIILPVGYASDHPTTGTSAEQHRTGPIVDPGTNLLDPIVALSACAARTRDIDLATGIFLVPLRPPAVSARMIHTLDQVSGGRVVLGVGAGWLEEEFSAVGVPFEARGKRLAEALEVMRRAWAGGPFSFHGDFFELEEVQLCTDPIHVPVIMGGNTDAALRRAARMGDGWFASGTPDYDDACRLRDSVLAFREAAGDRARTAGGEFLIYTRAPHADPDLLERYDRAGFERVLVWADQVWPVGAPLAERRSHLAKVAAELGIRPHRAVDANA
jgi:probable F420-dependent oxidoreductase